MGGRWLVVGAVLAGLGAAAGEEPGPLLTVCAVRPDRQLECVLDLFQGTGVAHPAAALAAWRRATGDRVSLSKPAQAILTLFNPEMIDELKAFDGAELVVADRPGWFVTVPRDDGALAALGAALALTDGGVDPALQDATVDRLGPAGSPLLARTATGAVALADDRADLGRALDRLRECPSQASPLDSGWLVRFDPEALGDAGPLDRRRLAEALRGGLPAGGSRRRAGRRDDRGDDHRAVCPSAAGRGAARSGVARLDPRRSRRGGPGAGDRTADLGRPLRGGRSRREGRPRAHKRPRCAPGLTCSPRRPERGLKPTSGPSCAV